MKRLFRQRLRRKVIVNLKDGSDFTGVLFDVDREAILLRNAQGVVERGERVPVDGEVLILRADIAFIQLP